MKKFTLSTVALSSIFLLNAATPKVVNVTSFPKPDAEKVMKTKVQAKSAFESSNLRVVATEKSLRELAPANVSAVAAADEETTEETIFPNYHYPEGALFPIWWVYQDQSTTEKPNNIVGPVYFGMGSMLLPAGHEITFPNMSYNSEGYLVNDADWKWSYEFAIFHQQYWSGIDESTDMDLTVSLAPHPILDYGVDAPTLAVGDKEFTLGTTEGTNFYATSITLGGSGHLNAGDESIYTTRYKLSNGSYRAWITNYNNAESVLSYSNAIGAGVDDQAFYGGISCNALRNQVLKEDLEKYGISADSFLGYAQAIHTSTQGGILSKITMPTSIKGAAGSEITITLYKIETEGEGENARDKYTEITTGIHTLEEDTWDTVDITLDLFDEVTENEYITLEPNSLYLVMYTDIAGLDAFVPRTPMFKYDTAVMSQLAGADVANRDEVYAMYLYNNTLAPVPVDYNWSGTTNTERKFYPALPIELEIYYPYITPMGVFTSSTTYKMLPASDTTVDAEFFSMGDEYLPAACVVAFSDMSADDLLNSVEYSSPELKDQIKVAVIAGEDKTSTNGNFPVSERSIYIFAQDNVPNGSWIKLHNYDQTLTINLAAYETSGIGDVVADGEAVATEYFDLQGRKLAGEANGIVLKKMTMADGSVKAVKVVK